MTSPDAWRATPGPAADAPRRFGAPAGPATNLLRHLGARHAPFLATSALLLGFFQFLICAAVASVDVGGALQTLLRSLPGVLQSAFVTQLFGNFSPRGLLAFGWNHPIAHALGTGLAIVLAARAVAGELESGALELHLCQPLSRPAYLAVQVLFALTALALLTLAGVAGSALGQRTFDLERFGPGPLARLGLEFWLLQAAWFGTTLLLSAWGREGGRVARLAFLIAVLSYFAQAIGQLWPRAAFVLPFTPYRYFSPHAILLEGASMLRPVAVLGGVLVATTVLAAGRFLRRDLS